MGLASLVLLAGLVFSGDGIRRFLIWAFSAGVFVFCLALFLMQYRQALTRYRIFLVVTAIFLLLSGLFWVTGLWGVPWDKVALVFTGMLILAAGVLFLEQKSIILRLGNIERSHAEEFLECWFVLDQVGRILDFDGSSLRLLKRMRGGVIGLSIHSLFPQVGKALGQIEANRRLDMDVQDDFFGPARLCRFSLYFPIQTRTVFEPRILKIRALPSYNGDAQQQGAADKSYEDLLRQKTLMQTALDVFTQGIMITDNSGKVIYRNQVLIELLDLPDHALVNDTEWDQTISRRMKDPERFTNFMKQILNQAVGETLDILECGDGRLLECRTRFYYVDSLGSGFRLWGFLDCTEQQRRERELQHMGMHDTLTGIYNRAFFDLKLRQLRLVSLYPVCMFMVDVDGLKHVNDYRGHSQGDQVLKQAAYVLRQACRTDDIVARLGGDEFGLLMVHADQTIAEQIATRIHGLINMYNIRHPDSPVSISMGFAIATSPKGMESLFSRADDAMYEARRKHRSGQNVLFG
jgi:diguanylate cyclase (GGDEF)-like protein